MENDPKYVDPIDSETSKAEAVKTKPAPVVPSEPAGSIKIKKPHNRIIMAIMSMFSVPYIFAIFITLFGSEGQKDLIGWVWFGIIWYLPLVLGYWIYFFFGHLGPSMPYRKRLRENQSIKYLATVLVLACIGIVLSIVLSPKLWDASIDLDIYFVIFLIIMNAIFFVVLLPIIIARRLFRPQSISS
ncbi:MAG: hypothetical protein R3313_00360 [Candidatus Saccharimonadales bacterium]|nr:hypothetical protein [Candidatus Saccharimonadales bacterium]